MDYTCNNSKIGPEVWNEGMTDSETGLWPNKHFNRQNLTPK